MTNFGYKSTVSKYLITTIAALMLSFSFCLVIELYSLFKSEKSINFEEKNIQQIAQILSIEDLQKTLANDRNNYFAAIKLANLYDEAKDFKTANKYFELALKTSGNSNYSLYSYAMFLSKHNLFLMSANIAEQLQGRNKKSFLYKSKIYESIADKLTEKKEVEAANKAYQVVYKYAKVLEDKDYLKSITEKYAQSYVNLADYYVEKNNVDYAVSSLKNAISIKETPMAQYKMALILKEVNPELSETYFSKVVKSNPFLINPYIYNNLLSNLIEKYRTSNVSRADFYVMKKNKLNKILSKNYIFYNDLDILNSQVVYKKKFAKKDITNFLAFDVKNNSNDTISDLFIKAELYLNKKIFEIDKRVVTPSEKLDINQTLSNVVIQLPQEMQIEKDNIQRDIIVKYFARKNKKAPWTIIKIDSVDF